MTAALRRVRGVTYANVDRSRSEATVLRVSGQAHDAELVQAVRRAGYSAQVIPIETARLNVRMEAENASIRVRSALSRVPGVRTVTIEGSRVARVDYDHRRVDEPRLVQAVRAAGFECSSTVASRPATPSRRTGSRPQSQPAGRGQSQGSR